MSRKYFLISDIREMLNQLEVQYDPKSTKPVLEQLLMQTIKAQGYNGPKSSITKIGEFVHIKVDDKLKAFMYFQPDDLKKFNETLIETRKRYREQNEIAADFGSIWQTTQSTHIKKGIRNDFSYHFYKPSLENSHKNYPIIIRDSSSLKLFKDRIHDMIHENQSPLHQESSTRKEALYSFVIIVYELPLGTKLRPEVQWFNQHDYT
ncbi:MAG: hypothetical protein EZS28_009968 [Streblomastix strix]|uniref:Uncharacterized protein n=1 Tax=Streblomastix strix TaxID=222440 RepID=A0A5J4WJL5_9EUKA|nr:MAG: hypothetical protein EZS28_009968 [Streblomastix strix]